MVKNLLATLFLSSSLFALEIKELDNATQEMSFNEANHFCTKIKGWRLPTAKELFRLFSDHTYEIKNQNRNYWSSTEYKGSKKKAWQVLHPDRDTSPMDKKSKLLALCVKDSTPKELNKNRFEILKNGLINDKQQKLYWQPLNRKDSRIRYNFTQAREHCYSLKMEGRSWRLPSLDEYFNVIDFSRTKPAIDKKIFKKTVFRYYWTNDFIENYNNEAYVVGLKIGTVATSSRENSSFVRCVSEY
jgi:hypothetical protein